jgi:hypothetical protein
VALLTASIPGPPRQLSNNGYLRATAPCRFTDLADHFDPIVFSCETVV